MEYLSIDGRLKEDFKSLLEEWDRTLIKYEKVLGIKDLPYGYGERTNLGILAVASAKLGFIALEEYRIEKEKKYGRADLWLYNREHSLDSV